MFDPDAGMPRLNIPWSTSVCASLPVSGWGAAGECAVVPTGKAIEESVQLAHEVFSRLLRRVLKQIRGATSYD
jgi:hypothetical protein